MHVAAKNYEQAHTYTRDNHCKAIPTGSFVSRVEQLEGVTRVAELYL